MTSILTQLPQPVARARRAMRTALISGAGAGRVGQQLHVIGDVLHDVVGGGFQVHPAQGHGDDPRSGCLDDGGGFISSEGYFPVPINRRESNDWSPMVSVSSELIVCIGSSSAHESENFEAVVVL